uniref:Uncharacterized protein n=1 Tax=Arundo donax TaxID=35708 RepID=A0A0A9D1R5_ARUDO
MYSSGTLDSLFSKDSSSKSISFLNLSKYSSLLASRFLLRLAVLHVYPHTRVRSRSISGARGMTKHLLDLRRKHLLEQLMNFPSVSQISNPWCRKGREPRW